MNERYTQPAIPPGSEEGIIKGMYLFRESDKSKLKVQLLGSGAILNEVIAAADLLQKDFGVSADIWSVTSFNELSREGTALQREQMFMPSIKPKMSYVEECLQDRKGPVIASTDYVRAYAEQIRPFISRSYTVLGTDGFGRSDTRDRLRHFFENDRHHVAVAALFALAKEGAVPMSQVTAAIKKYNIDTNKPNPITV
jgi:pyruvate dehydrogenase E1 component